jgi:hypothetical protein
LKNGRTLATDHDRIEINLRFLPRLSIIPPTYVGKCLCLTIKLQNSSQAG